MMLPVAPALITDNDVSDAEAARIIQGQLDASEAKCSLLAHENRANDAATQLWLDIWHTTQEIVGLMTPERREAWWHTYLEMIHTDDETGSPRLSSMARRLEDFNRMIDRSGEAA